MAKKGLLILVVTVFSATVSACASIGVVMEGKDYFTGKPESELTQYFGYEGAVFDGEGEYDRIVYFTNKVVKFEMSKTTIQRYKVSESKRLYSFVISEHNDGCFVSGGNHHYYSYGSGSSGFRVDHRNDNALVKSNITLFNNEVKRLNAIPQNNQKAYFDKSNIGDWFFVYQITQRSARSLGIVNSVKGSNFSIPSEIYTIYEYTIWRVDVVADDKATTTKYIIATYDDRSTRYYDGNGNIVSKEQTQAIYDEYVKNGFEPNTVTDGFSVLAYVNDGKVVKVE